mmetsp:Transcript_35961/g.60582  ORF Transcript_35961/g.60582 Transcript_35961/m.60582 type:complete len:527 (+) Transcript_35961:150-1730(+)|eukprot:CAMPEP_0198209318 /NCGR_PEP_ID=MMETSP1445-20131203/14840_1 /TAXON_ID=36898 /ORGANISM="Pyramimonas sp., Strain CCMP2087" /LENGTH=526 /DNA_ID=CAMNT_0043883055 /DNA_START=131 /DNA_END=1711 /DNA_ORIENTATION=+
MGGCCGKEDRGKEVPATYKPPVPVRAVPPGQAVKQGGGHKQPPNIATAKLTHAGSVLKRDVGNLRDHYVLGRELGRGQFGVTKLATHKLSGKQYACKSISKVTKLKTQEDRSDVRREMDIMYHLQGHANIVEMVDAFEDIEDVHLVMELCTGGELFDRIIERQHYSEKQAAATFRTIMSVVAESHALGVMHRDLKPENFLLKDKSEDSLVKATDWGLSAFVSQGKRFSDVVGSAYYIAPEVLKKSYGHEADVWSAGVILYILLSGVPPFWHETEQGIFAAISKGEYDLTNKPWPKISTQAKDLIKRLLTKDPEKRISAAQALKHPWLRVGGEAPDTVLDDTVLTRMRKFSGMNRLKKMALHVIAKNMAEHEITGLKELFKSFDTDNSGTITLQELREGLHSMGSPLSAKEVEEVMQAADIDGDGNISYEEFIAATLHRNKAQVDENLWSAFCAFDTDNSGFITPDELSAALVKYKMDVKNIDEILRDVDTDGDGRICYEEFVQLMQGIDRGDGGGGLLISDVVLQT